MERATREGLQEMRGLEYRGPPAFDGPLVIARDAGGPSGFDELVVVYDRARGERTGRVLDTSETSRRRAGLRSRTPGS